MIRCAMAKILSTKILSESTFERLLAAGHSITHYDLFNSEPLPFAAPLYDIYICSSQNAVASLKHYWKNQPVEYLLNTDWYCVGEKTKESLESLGLNVIVCAETAEELIEKYLDSDALNDKRKLWLTGVRKTPATHAYLQAKKADYIDVYVTIPNLKVFEQSFDGILFYSAHGVDTFMKAHQIDSATTLFCIGTTTATAALKFSQKVVTAKQASAERLVADTVLYFKNA